MKLEDFRREYLSEQLCLETLLPNPIEQFDIWMEQTIASGLNDPTAMVLATVSADGQPSQRIVLLKDVVDGQFVFYTNFGSKKAQDIKHNSKVSLLFPWHKLNRQIKICGSATKVSTSRSLKYFLSRPKDSQLAAWASAQSRELSSRQFLLSEVARLKEKFSEGDIPLPDFWGGYQIRPDSMEFWQGGENRIHDRFVYIRDIPTTKNVDSWSIKRLAP